MSSAEELPGGEQSPRRLSQIFEPLVDFHKSAQAKTVQKTNPGSSRLATNSSSTPNSPRYVMILPFFIIKQFHKNKNKILM